MLTLRVIGNWCYLIWQLTIVWAFQENLSTYRANIHRLSYVTAHPPSPDTVNIDVISRYCGGKSLIKAMSQSATKITINKVLSSFLINWNLTRQRYQNYYSRKAFIPTFFWKNYWCSPLCQGWAGRVKRFPMLSSFTQWWRE